MRKKSHVSLSRYLLDHIDSELLENHRKAFIVGSVLPDCKPSFVTTKHNMEETFDMVCEFIRKLTVNSDDYKKISTAYCRKLGEVTHYLADYFTFPHNTIYPGSLKDHCSYEEKLKRDLRSYLKSGEATRHHRLLQLKEEHEKLQNKKKAHKHGVEDDIEHIVEVNHKALDAMMKLLANKRAEWRIRHS